MGNFLQKCRVGWCDRQNNGSHQRYSCPLPWEEGAGELVREDMMMEVVVRLQLLALEMEEDHEPGNEGPLSKLQKAKKQILF